MIVSIECNEIVEWLIDFHKNWKDRDDLRE